MVESEKDIFDLIDLHKSEIANYGAKSIGLFGSFTSNSVTASSDVDLIVDFEAGKKNYDNFINLAFYLESLFGRRVELLTQASLSKHLKPLIEKNVKYVAVSL